MQKIDLKTLTDETFVELCHALLSKEHGETYRPVDGSGGDRGIDGYTQDYFVVYQIKFYKSRPRPATFVREIDKVVSLSGLRTWVLVIPDDPTPKLNELIAREKAIRQFDVQVVGKTWILTLLDKHESVRNRFFAQSAKEESVQNILDFTKFRARKSTQEHKDIRREIRNLKQTVERKKPSPISVGRPPDCITPQHEREIKDEIRKIVEANKGESFKKIFRQLKNRYVVANWHLIPDQNFGDILSWLHRYHHAVKDTVTPEKKKNQLKGIIKSQQKALGLSDKQYRALLMNLVNKSSTTQMDIKELDKVKDHLNIMLGSSDGKSD